PPADRRAPEEEGLAGPPETTGEYIEEVGHHRPAPVAPPAPAPEAPEPAPRQSWFQRLTGGLRRSSDQLTQGITSVFTRKKLDQAMLDELEDILIQADFGIDVATEVVEALRRERF